MYTLPHFVGPPSLSSVRIQDMLRASYRAATDELFRVQLNPGYVQRIVKDLRPCLYLTYTDLTQQPGSWYSMN